MTNIVMKIVLAVTDFVLINIVLSVGGIDIYSISWYALCMALGFGLRVAVLVKDNKYTTKVLFIHMVFTLSWCFLTVLIWRTGLDKTWINRGGNSFEIYLFLNSLFSVYLVGQFEFFFKLGFKQWLSLKVSSLIAKDQGKLIAKDNQEDDI